MSLSLHPDTIRRMKQAGFNPNPGIELEQSQELAIQEKSKFPFLEQSERNINYAWWIAISESINEMLDTGRMPKTLEEIERDEKCTKD